MRCLGAQWHDIVDAIVEGADGHLVDVTKALDDGIDSTHTLIDATTNH
jgi:hypothetical protein